VVDASRPRRHWRKLRAGEPLVPISKFGTVDWLFREFKASNAYKERVSQRTRPDYERIMLLVADYKTKRGDRIGDRKVKAITPVSADKLYALLCEGPKGKRPRQGEKVIAVCRRAWKVVRRLYPDQFDKDLPNPWEGVTKAKRNLKTKDAVDRDQVYTFARRALEFTLRALTIRRLAWADLMLGRTMLCELRFVVHLTDWPGLPF
jgi:hypothetical protein